MGRLAKLDGATSNAVCSMCPYTTLLPRPTLGGKEEGEEARAGGAAARAAAAGTAAGLGCTTVSRGDAEGLVRFGSAAPAYAAAPSVRSSLQLKAVGRCAVAMAANRQHMLAQHSIQTPGSRPNPAHGSGGHGGDGGFFVVEQP